MENYPIKSVTFGGFDKQDVIRYIEQTVLENDAARKELQDEIDRLHMRIDELTAANSALQNDVEILSAEKAAMEENLRDENNTSSAKITALEKEIAALRPDAANYALFRDRLGSIECEARERADALERSSSEQLNKTVEDFRNQYATLVSIVETTTAYITGELRKMEVNLTQLPRALDRPGAELAELTKKLKGE